MVVAEVEEAGMLRSSEGRKAAALLRGGEGRASVSAGGAGRARGLQGTRALGF